MTRRERKKFWFDQMVNECVDYFGWSVAVAAIAIVTNRNLVEGLLNQYEMLHCAAKNLESVFTNLLKED